jgi:inorganic triphosphatase YgiF
VERELKLSVEAADQRRLARLDALRALTSGPVRSERLHSVYFDTPDHALAAERVALRLRERPGRRGSTWVQTVKDGGTAAGGLHQRQELEWPVAGPRLDLALIDASPLAERFRKPRLRDGLAPVFRTDFQRSTRVLRCADGTTVELAMDLGEVRAGRRTEPIAEVELELLSGDVDRLFDLAAIILQAVPARLAHASKAERGYRLARGLRLAPPRKAQPIALERGMTVAAGLRRVLGTCLEQMQANEPGVLAGRQPEHLHQFRVGMRRLRSALSLAAIAVGREAVAPFAAELRALGAELNPARDWDVFMTGTLPPLAASFPQVEGLADLQRSGARLRVTHNRAARAALAAARYQALLIGLGRVLARDDLAAWRAPPPAPQPDATQAHSTQAHSTQAHSTQAHSPQADAPQADAPADAPPAALPPTTADAPEPAPVAVDVHPLDQPLEDFAAALLRRRDRKLRKRGASVPDATPEARHEVRIAGKKLRYAAEFFAELYSSRKVTRYVAALEGIQDILGALNDAAVTDRLLAEAHARTPITPEAAGIVRGWFAATAVHELGRFRAAWSEFEAARPYWREKK